MTFTSARVTLAFFKAVLLSCSGSWARAFGFLEAARADAQGRCVGWIKTRFHRAVRNDGCMRQRLTMFVSLMAMFGCGSHESNEARLAGCYSIEVKNFAPSTVIQASHTPPRMVRLDTTKKEFLLNGELDHRTIADVVGGGDFFFTRDAAWTLQNDTLSLVWSSAFTGAELRLLARGSRMQGNIQFFSDQPGTPMPKASVTLRRQSCP